MKVGVYVGVAAMVLMLSTCTSDVYNPDVCFQENVLPIFVSNCTTVGCHNSSSRRDYSTYEGIMSGVSSKHPAFSEVYSAISGNNPSMPPAGKLSAKDVSYIKIWIKMGAENSSNCSNCDSTTYTFSGRIKPLMNTWCVGCHQSTNTGGGGYDLSNYNGIVNAISNNKLLGAVEHLPGSKPMPQNSNKLSSCDINAISKWINAGNPNN